LVVFMLPAMVLGTISPAMAKMALERSTAVGTTIGSVYAWATVGSILGTLATGFFLISALGAHGVVMVVSLGLALIGLTMGPYRWAHLAWVIVVGVFFFFAISPTAKAQSLGSKIGLRESSTSIYAKDSDYQFVKVYEDDSGKDKNRTIRVLSLDYLIHGYVDEEDPTFLEYDYEHVYRDVARRFAQGKKRVSAFFLGGGAYTFPRWVMHEWPGSHVDVAEIDPQVLEANHRALGLPRDTPIRTYIGDARNVLDDLPEGMTYDLVFGDAFNDLSVPWHLTTVEFSRKIRGHLTPGGAYLVNIIDDWKHALFLGAFVSTLKLVFKHVYVFCTEKDGITSGRETFVVAAANVPLDVSEWMPGHKGDFAGSTFTPKDMEKLAKKSKGRILTDDYAPVENLLEPVVRARQ
jgi:spermidine synthase